MLATVFAVLTIVIFFFTILFVVFTLIPEAMPVF